MKNPYVEIFKAPGAIGFSLAGFIARIPMSMTAIGIIAMLSQIGDSYGSSGYVSAAYILASAIISPQLSRLADRLGQFSIVILGSSICAISLCLLIIAAYNNAPLWLLMMLAIGTGFMPNFGAFVRARWSKLYGGLPKLRSAFAFESIVEEIIFIAGPIIALFLTTHFFPAAGSVATITFLIVGSFVFLTQRKTEPKVSYSAEDDNTSVIRLPQIFLLSLTLVATGAIFGGSEISTLAFAKELNQQAWASIPLAAYAFGSFIAGIIYGALNIRALLSKQFLVMMIIAAATTVPLFFVYDLLSLTIILCIAGAACAPTIIIAMSLVEAIVPKNKLTEGMSWAVTGMSIGAALGAAVAGQLIDSFGAISGFYVVIVAGFSAMLIAILGYNVMKTKSTMAMVDQQ